MKRAKFSRKGYEEILYVEAELSCAEFLGLYAEITRSEQRDPDVLSHAKSAHNIATLGTQDYVWIEERWDKGGEPYVNFHGAMEPESAERARRFFSSIGIKCDESYEEEDPEPLDKPNEEHYCEKTKYNGYDGLSEEYWHAIGENADPSNHWS